MNLLFVTIDQWRGDALSRRGHRAALTPNLDRLAANAVAFDNHFSQATPCGPSRASIHTGQYAFNHRSIANGTPLDARHKTWAEILAREGHGETALFGYTDTSIDPRTVEPGDPRLSTYESVARGFEPTEVVIAGLAPWLDYLERRGYGELDYAELFSTPLGEPARFRAEDSLTAWQCRRFLDWQAGRKPGWSAHLSLLFPHPPYVAAAPFNDVVAESAVPPPLRAPTLEAEAALHPWLAAALKRPHRGDNLPQAGEGPWALDLARTRALRRVYFGLVREADHHVGLVLDELARRGALDDTLVIVTSDHGELIGDHWLVGKAAFFAEAFHVPLIVRAPGCVRGRVVTAFTEHVDLAPTILDRFGIEPPLQFDGASLEPWLRGDTPGEWRDAAIMEHDCRNPITRCFESELGLAEDQTNLAVRLDARWAYVQFAALSPLLFDRRHDPGWRRNLLAEPGFEAAGLACAEAMLRHRFRHAERRLTGALLDDAGPVGRYEDRQGRVVRFDQRRPTPRD